MNKNNLKFLTSPDPFQESAKLLPKKKLKRKTIQQGQQNKEKVLSKLLTKQG